MSYIKIRRIVRWLGVLLIAMSPATCWFGTRYAIGKIPPDRRAGMADTDWIGVEWIKRGGLLFLVGGALLLASVPNFGGGKKRSTGSAR